MMVKRPVPKAYIRVPMGGTKESPSVYTSIREALRELSDEVAAAHNKALEVESNLPKITTATIERVKGGAVSAGSGGGSVTSVALTMPAVFAVSGSPIVTSGTLAVTANGTSGGVPYFNAATTLASSGVLTASALVLGGGAGAAPSTPTGLGTTTTILHGNAAGAPTWGAVSLTADVTGTLPIANGGTNATTAAAARTSLGLVIGTDVQAYSARLTDIAALAVTDSNIMVGNGSTWVAENGATARTSLGLTIGTDVPGPTGTGASGTWGIGISGNAATVTNGVYTTGSYADPAWLTSLAGTKISGNISGNAANVTGVIALVNGGTGTAAASANAAFNALSPLTTLGDVLYGAASGVGTRLIGNTTITRKFLRQTGDGVNSAAPVWDTLQSGDLPGGTGTVTSVGLSTPAEFTVAGSPVTTSGTLSASWASAGANLVFAGMDGMAGTPSFRSLVTADIPNLATSKITSGTFAVARGGTGLSTIGGTYQVLYTSATDTIAALAGNSTATRKFLRQVDDGMGTPTAPAWDTVTKADVGLASVENTALSTWTGSANVVTVGTISTGTWNGTDVAVAAGGTGASDAATARTNLGLAIGTDVQAYNATLAAVAGGTYTGDDSIVTVGTITGGTWNAGNVTSSGSINVFGAPLTFKVTSGGTVGTNRFAVKGAGGTGRFGVDFNEGGPHVGINGIVENTSAENIRTIALVINSVATAGAETGTLSIYTKPSGSGVVERFIIDGNGRVTVVGAGAPAATDYMSILIGERAANDNFSSIRLAPQTTAGRGWTVDVFDDGTTGQYFQIYDDLNDRVGLKIANSGEVTFSGGIKVPVVSKSIDYTATTSDFNVLCTGGVSGITITLPAATNTGLVLHIEKVDSGAGAVTVSRAGSDTIEGATTASLASQYSSVTLVADGTATWYKIASL